MMMHAWWCVIGVMVKMIMITMMDDVDGGGDESYLAIPHFNNDCFFIFKY